MDVVGSESSVLEVVFALVPAQSAPLSRALFPGNTTPGLSS